jgi:hypothetical protein
MMASRSLICLLENQNGGKLQKVIIHNLDDTDDFRKSTRGNVC